MTQLVKNLPAMQEMWVQSLGWEDLLRKRKATHSRILENSMDSTVHGVTKSHKQQRLSLKYSLKVTNILIVWYLSFVSCLKLYLEIDVISCHWILGVLAFVIPQSHIKVLSGTQGLQHTDLILRILWKFSWKFVPLIQTGWNSWQWFTLQL